MTTSENRPVKVSIDELAAMVANGFSSVDKSFARLEDKISEIDTRLINVEENMATKDDIHRLEKRFDGVEKTVFNDHGRRLRKIETKLQIA